MSSLSPHIVLYNEVSGVGHHESWTALFTEILLDRGYTVTCLTPDCATMKEILSSHGIDFHKNLSIISLTQKKSISPSQNDFFLLILLKSTQIIKKTIWNFSQRIKKLYSMLKMGKNISSEQIGNSKKNPNNAPDIQKRRIFSILILTEVRNSFRLFSEYMYNYCTFFYYFSPHYAEPGKILNIIRDVSKYSKVPDFFFIMHLDKWSVAPTFMGKNETLPIFWGGLTFMHNIQNQYGKEWFFNQQQFRGMCFLNENAPSFYQKKYPKHHFCFLPDITNTNLPLKSSPRVEEMKKRALKRSIVLLCGSIDERKNIALFCELACNADPDVWFFAIVGQRSDNLSNFENEILKKIAASPHNNTYVYTEHLSDERELNSFIHVSDMLFAVYVDFQISSNMVTKAAFFEKPILVSEKYLMGYRVKRYNIGRSVPEKDVDAIFRAMEELITSPIPKGNFNMYCEDFNIKKMGDAFESFIIHCLDST